MEILERVNLNGNKTWILIYKNGAWAYTGKTLKNVNEMTKDLIKEEMRRRVFSFRPTWLDCQIYKTRLAVTEGFIRREKIFWVTP